MTREVGYNQKNKNMKDTQKSRANRKIFTATESQSFSSHKSL